MASQKQEKAVDIQRQTVAGEPSLEAATWLAPFSSGTFLSLQSTIGNRAVSQLLQADMGQHHQNGNGHLQLGIAPTTIQTKPQNGEQAGGATERATEPAAPARQLIVDDDAKQLQPGQMKKTEFLDRLKASVCGAAEDALRNTMWSAMGCPYIERWFGHYAGQDSQHVERALRKYAPETARANSASDYIPIVTERVRRGLSQWAETGEITGVPEEFAHGELPGATLQGLVSGALSGIGSAIGSAASAIGSAVSSAGRALFKARDGGEKDVGDPEAIRSQLGSGHSLDGGTRQRMEKGFGVSFSGVRVHTGAQAESLSESMNARAFTVGNDIAFGAGEYSPGTLVGDALIAHELAHTVQQGNGTAQVASRGDHGQGGLEEEADIAAVGAVASAWGLQGARAGAFTQLRSGLRLQRCGGAQKAQTRSPSEYQKMTPWELSQLTDAELDKAAATTQPSGGLTVEDYKRAAQFARAYFKPFHIDFDIETYNKPLGEEPNDAQLAVLDKILNQLLGASGGAVKKVVEGPEGRGRKPLQRDKGTGKSTLKGRVRYWPKEDDKSRGQFMAKNYRLSRTIGVAPLELETRVGEELRRVGLTAPASTSRITYQEKLVTIFAISAGGVAGFYLPVEDTFYLAPGTNLNELGVQGVARHEMVHLLGGAEKTRDAFKDRYKGDYIPHWRAFEEGMAEVFTRETQSAAEAKAMPPPDDFYVQARERMEKLMATKPENRQLLLNAYFTGNITKEVFELLDTVPPPKQ